MCGMCGKGQLIEKNVTLTLDDEDEQVTVLIHDVPARVCDSCGERFFDGPTVDETGKVFHAAVEDAVAAGKALRIVTYQPQEPRKPTRRRPMRRKTTKVT